MNDQVIWSVELSTWLLLLCAGVEIGFKQKHLLCGSVRWHGVQIRGFGLHHQFTICCLFFTRTGGQKKEFKHLESGKEEPLFIKTRSGMLAMIFWPFQCSATISGNLARWLVSSLPSVLMADFGIDFGLLSIVLLPLAVWNCQTASFLTSWGLRPDRLWQGTGKKLRAL